METKSNQPAESAATDQLSTSNNKAANQSKKSTHKIKTVSMFHEEECFICHKNAGEQENTSFIGCSFCPKSYHLSCLPAGTIITSPRWGCPAHKCATCGAPSSKSRGKMFRCVSCPTALCSLHVPKDCKVVPQNILEERGYSSSSFHFIFCHKCEDLDSKVTGQKRTASEAGLDIASILKKRKVGSNQMVKSPPDEQILIPMRGLFSSGFVFQKQVADEIGISQPLLSQYVHGATRNNGWRFLEEKLKIWLDKHTDLIARLESEAKSVEPQVQPQQPIVPEPIIKQEPIHHHHQRAASNDVKIRLRLNNQSQPDLQPKEQPMWEPHRNFIPVLTAYEIAALQQQEENNSLILGESPTFYGSDSSEIEAEETGVWAIDIFQQNNNRSQETAYY